MRHQFDLIICALLCTLLVGCCSTKFDDAGGVKSGYLFTSFHDADQKYLRFLYSYDGYHWTNVPGTFQEANVGMSKQFRDPSIARGPDGSISSGLDGGLAWRPGVWLRAVRRI